MQVIQKTATKEALKDNDYRDIFVLEVNGVTELMVTDNIEPEDCSLARDLNFVFSIPDLMRKAWQAGRNREPFDFVAEQRGDLHDY